MAPTALVFLMLMGVSIAALNILMIKQGAENDYTISIIMIVPVFISFTLLARYLRAMKQTGNTIKPTERIAEQTSFPY